MKMIICTSHYVNLGKLLNLINAHAWLPRLKINPASS